MPVPDQDLNIHLRKADVNDAAAIAAIYNQYVNDTIITFEEAAVDTEEMARRIADVSSKRLPWYLAAEQDRAVGYAYATPWRSRSAYRFSVEVTVYVAPGHTGRGVGTRLYTVLLDALRDGGFHSAIAGIALPNPESVALHERLGFEKVARFKRVGFKMNRWVDVGYWQLMLDTGNRYREPD
jgi:L-amino acid N-acyltransferase YncA